MAENERIVTLAYCGEGFRFGIIEQTEDFLRGCFLLTEDEKARLHRMLMQEEEEKQPWYLDDDGYRLDDDELFEKSPWSMIDGDTHRKAVERYMDWSSGKAWFCFNPWFRIGDELNRPRGIS